jgi:malonate transporter
MGLSVLTVLSPVYGLIALGLILGRLKSLHECAFDVLNRFVISVTLPVLTFRRLAKTAAHDLMRPVMLIAVVGGARRGLCFWVCYRAHQRLLRS